MAMMRRFTTGQCNMRLRGAFPRAARWLLGGRGTRRRPVTVAATALPRRGRLHRARRRPDRRLPDAWRHGARQPTSTAPTDVRSPPATARYRRASTARRRDSRGRSAHARRASGRYRRDAAGRPGAGPRRHGIRGAHGGAARPAALPHFTGRHRRHRGRRWLGGQSAGPGARRPGRHVGISFSGGLSVVAAGRPGIRDRVAFVLSFGGHGDLSRVMHYLCSGEVLGDLARAARQPAS